MIRPGKGEFPALEDIELRVSENVVDPQCRGKMDKGPADTEPSLQKGVFPWSPDGEVGIRIGDVVKIPADDPRERAAVQPGANLLRLIAPVPEGVGQFFCNGFGGRKDT